MSSCEKCWGDAYLRMRNTGKAQYICYHELLIERAGNPCTPEEQAGQWWDEEKQCDRRYIAREQAEG